MSEDKKSKERLEKEAKNLKEKAEEEQRRKEEEAAEEERKRRAAAAAAAARAQQAAGSQQKNRMEPKTEPQVKKMPSVVFSPEAPRFKSPAPGTLPRPEPNFIKKFRENLEEDKKKSMHYEPKKDQLIFTGSEGLDVLTKFLEQNPGVEIILQTSRSMLRNGLRDLKNCKSGNGVLLDNLTGIEMEGRLIQGDEMQKVKQAQVGTPRPSASGLE